MASSGSSSSSSNPPCAACKILRRKCMPGCVFAPYFPPEDPQKFAKVQKVFGASNVAKLLNDLLPGQREDAVNSLAYEAEARVKDPVYGCVATISVLQQQIRRLQKELDAANADLLRYACNEIPMGFHIREIKIGEERGSSHNLLQLQQDHPNSLAIPAPPWPANDFSALEDTTNERSGEPRNI